MSAHGNNPEFHSIKDGLFDCTAPEDAPCRTSPTCECDEWCCCDGSAVDRADNHDADEHCCMTTTKPGQGCWMEPWVDAGDIEDSFAGDLAPLLADQVGADEFVWPDGPVTVDWEGDGCTWDYVEVSR